MKDIFLDFDDTITCIECEPVWDEDLGLWCHKQMLKNNVNNFLKFLTDNFNVFWCSFNSNKNIRERLKDVVDKDILNKIPYFNCCKYGFSNKVAEINEISKNYIFIDDSFCSEEQKLIPENCLFVQACETDMEDLVKIETEIREKLKMRT